MDAHHPHPFTDAFAPASIGVAVVDLQGRIEVVNDALAAMLGRDPNDLAGVGLLDLVHPDDRTALTVQLDSATDAGWRASPAVVRASTSAGGVSRRLHVVVHPLIRAGAVDAFIVALGSLRESLSMERRLNVLLARSDERIIVLGVDWTILYASPAERRELGLMPRGPFPWERFEPGGASTMRTQFAATLAEPGARAPITVRVRTDEGRWRVREVTMTNMVDEPAFGGIIVNSRDITAPGVVPSPYKKTVLPQPTETGGAALGLPLFSVAEPGEWIVLLEAEAGANAILCDLGTFQAILRALGAVGGLYVPERYAVQIPAVGVDIFGAFARALDLWRDVALPLTPEGWSLIRAEVLTREELDRELKAGE